MKRHWTPPDGGTETGVGTTAVLAAFAIAQVIAVASLPATASGTELALVEGGLLGLLIGAIYYDTGSVTACVAATGSVLAFLGLIWLTWSLDTWLMAVVLIGGVGLLLYGTHRYELVVLDQVKRAPERASTVSPSRRATPAGDPTSDGITTQDDE